MTCTVAPPVERQVAPREPVCLRMMARPVSPQLLGATYHLARLAEAWPDLDTALEMAAALAADLLDAMRPLDIEVDPFYVESSPRPPDTLMRCNVADLLVDLLRIDQAQTPEAVARAVAQTLVNLDALMTRYGLDLWSAVEARNAPARPPCLR